MFCVVLINISFIVRTKQKKWHNGRKNCPDRDILPLLDRLCKYLEISELEGHDNLMLTWDQIKEMAENDISFGAHTVNHPILSRTSMEIAERKIMESQKTIEGKIDKRVTSFAYPFGEKAQYGPQIDKIIERINSERGAVETKTLTVVKSNEHTTVLKLEYISNDSIRQTMYIKRADDQSIQNEYLALKYMAQKKNALRHSQIPEIIYYWAEENILVTSGIEGQIFRNLFFCSPLLIISKNYRNKLCKIAYDSGKAFRELQEQFIISHKRANFNYIINLIKENVEELSCMSYEMKEYLFHTLSCVIKRTEDRDIPHAFSHGDLMPQNILIGKNGRVGFIDWGYQSDMRLPIYSDIASFMTSLRFNLLLDYAMFPREVGDCFLHGYFQNNHDIDPALLCFFSIKSITSLGVYLLRRHNNFPYRKVILCLLGRMLLNEKTKLEHLL